MVRLCFPKLARCTHINYPKELDACLYGLTHGSIARPAQASFMWFVCFSKIMIKLHNLDDRLSQ
jgi:hypothetical protein